MKLSIKQRIAISFYFMGFLFIANGSITILTLRKNHKMAQHVTGIVLPSMEGIDNFTTLLLESKMYTTNWVFLRSNEEDKKELKKIHDYRYHTLKNRITTHTSQWAQKSITDSLQQVFTRFEQLLVTEKKIMVSLQKFENYDDPVARLEAERMVEDEVLPQSAAIENSLERIHNYGWKLYAKAAAHSETNRERLRNLIIVLIITFIVGGFLLSLYLTKKIISPINRIRHMVNDMGKGITSKKAHHTTGDEIGEMVGAVNNLSEKLQVTSLFAHEIGKRNFDMPFHPLGEEDTLGKALIAMRDNLKTSEQELLAATDNLHKKDQLMQAVAEATYELISNCQLEEAIGKTIRSLGKGIDVDGVNIYKIRHNEKDGLLYADLFMRWMKHSDTTDTNLPVYYNFNIMPHVHSILRNNEIFFRFTENVEDPELQQIFRKRNIKSVVVIPVFIMQEFWGFVALSNCYERMWTETEFSILKSFAVTLGTAIERIQMQQQLIIARDNAEAASKAKSDFMANMSHELRTPMNGIIGFTDLVLATELQKVQRDYLKNVSKSAYNLLSIINDLLDFSKIEAGKLHIDEVPFNLTELVQETVAMYSVKAAEKGLELICSIDPGLPSKMMGDPVRIKQVLTNLIDNAVKFTANGEAFIKVIANKMYNCNGSLYMDIDISVKDTGIGISETKLHAIFDSFTQADTSTTRRYGGTGLGLTISKKLVELMGGLLVVESMPDKGSNFTCSLGLKVVNATVVKIEPWSAISVLVVEDEPVNMLLISEVLRKMGIEVIKADNGREAIDRLTTHNPSLVFMDVNMPVMDGFTATGLIRQLTSSHSCVPIVALTADAMEEDRERCLESGMNDYISKPFRLEEIQEVIKKYCNVPMLKKIS